MGRFSGIAQGISVLADRIRQDREAQQEMGMKQNLLGYAAQLEGKLTPAQPNEPEAMNIPGVGWKKPHRLTSGNLPPGFIVVNGEVKSDPSYKRQETQEERTANLSDEIAKKELSTMTTLLHKLDQADQAVMQLETLFKGGASPDKNPVVARVSGVADYLGAKSGFNPKLNAYLNNRKAFAGLIAKGGFGEAGMLTNQDIERVVSALPGSSSTPEEAKIGFQEVRNLLSSARKRFEDKKSQYLKSPQQNLDSDSQLLQPKSEFVTIQDPTGKTIQISRQEAIQRGYINE